MKAEEKINALTDVRTLANVAKKNVERAKDAYEHAQRQEKLILDLEKVIEGIKVT